MWKFQGGPHPKTLPQTLTCSYSCSGFWGCWHPPGCGHQGCEIRQPISVGGGHSSEGRHRSTSLCSSPWLTPKGPQRKAGWGLARAGPRIAQQGYPGLGRHGVPGLSPLFCLMGGPGPEGGAKLSLKGWGAPVSSFTAATASCRKCQI